MTDVIKRRGSESLRAVVTGLPRSGTSFVTGLIARLGLHPGPRWLLRRGNRHNPYGYFEHIFLNRITNRLLADMDRDFDLNLPDDRAEFEIMDLDHYRRKIMRHISRGRIQIYKDNKLVLYPELYADIFPRARFIFVSRREDARFKSRFGKAVSRAEWEDFNARRMALWRASPVSKRALTVAYEDFFQDPGACIEAIAGYLELTPGAEQKRAAMEFFKPRNPA